MKLVSATTANRDFSKLLDEISRIGPVGITKRGKIVATISPVKPADEGAEAFKRAHVAQLLSQPAMNIPRGTRDELYEN